MVKVAIVDNNENYLKRLQDYWSKAYGSGAVMVYVFSSWQQFLERLEKEKIDVLLVNNRMEADLGQLPGRIVKIYLLPGKRGGEIDGVPALPKNGNADELYRKMMELYSSHINLAHAVMPGRMLFFTSSMGGSGTSSCAVGCGKYLSSLGKKVLYLNLEDFGAQRLMLEGKMKEDMGQLIYLCKTNRKNLNFSVDNITGIDKSGLRFIAQYQNPMELRELTVEDMKDMVIKITEKGAFDFVIIDRGFSLEEKTDVLLELAHRVILVSDSSQEGQEKLMQAKAYLDEANSREKPVIGNKVRILYNKTGAVEESAEILGSVPFKEGKDPAKIAEQIGSCSVFGRLVEQDA